MIWTVGCTGDNDSWIKFSNWVKEKMKENKVSMSLLYMVKGQGHLYKISFVFLNDLICLLH